MATKVYNFRVELSCGSCVRALERALSKNNASGEILEHDISLDEQRVTITTTLSLDSLKTIMDKTGLSYAPMQVLNAQN